MVNDDRSSTNSMLRNPLIGWVELVFKRTSSRQFLCFSFPWPHKPEETKGSKMRGIVIYCKKCTSWLPGYQYMVHCYSVFFMHIVNLVIVRKEKKRCHKMASSIVTRRPSYVQVASKLAPSLLNAWFISPRKRTKFL